MSLPGILPIVEGRSEVEGVPVLLRRLLESASRYDVGVERPFRVPRTRIMKAGELERAVIYAPRLREGGAGILVLVDADDDDRTELETTLTQRCRQATALPTEVVVAERELEAWFLGAKESLRGVRGIRADAQAPSRPEQIRGAKERLSANMQGKGYLEVDDQPALASALDLGMAEARCASFARLRSAMGRLVEQIGSRA